MMDQKTEEMVNDLAELPRGIGNMFTTNLTTDRFPSCEGVSKRTMAAMLEDSGFGAAHDYMKWRRDQIVRQFRACFREA